MATEAHHLSPDELIARIDDWKGKDVRWEELGGGITNHNYIVWVNGGWGNPGGGKYVLRVPGAGTDMFIDRDIERECMIEVARIGTAPRVAHVIEPEKAMVIDFIDGEVMHPDTMAGHPERIRQAVEAVRAYHDKAVFNNRIEIFDMLRRYTKVAQDIDAPMPERLAALLERMPEIEEAVGARSRTRRRLPERPPLRELHHRRRRQDVDHRLGVRRHDRPVLRSRRPRHGAPVLA